MRRFMLLVLLGMSLGLPLLAQAQNPPVHWDRYAYAVAVQPNGDLRFTETQTLVIDKGPIRRGTLSFNTGSDGRVEQITVAEGGRGYEEGGEEPGMFTGSDDGTKATITYYFLDPNATRHEMTIRYVVRGALRAAGTDQARLRWNFFCNGSCPRADTASIRLSFPSNLPADLPAPSTSGFAVETNPLSNGFGWVARAPISGQQLRVDLNFPTSLVPQADLTTSSAAPASSSSSGSLTFMDLVICLVVLVILFLVIRTLFRWLAKLGRGVGGPSTGPSAVRPKPHGKPRPEHYSSPSVVPPVIIPGPAGSVAGEKERPDSNSGSGSSWSDSNSGGGSTWSDSSTSGVSFSDSSSSGGGSTWSDSGSSSSSSSSSSSGGGSDNSSSFG